MVDPSNSKKKKQKESIFRKSTFWWSALGATALVAGAIVIPTQIMNKDEEPDVPKEPTPVNLTDSKAMNWLTNFEKERDYKDWKTEESVNHNRIFKSLDCEALDERPLSHMASFSGSNDEYKEMTQVFAPGTAVKQLYVYASDISDCSGSLFEVEETDSGSHYVITDQGLIMVSGDALISIEAPEKTDYKSLINKTEEDLQSSLKESECLNLEVSKDDYKRNKFVSQKEYTGLIESETVTSDIPLDNIPTIDPPDLKEVKDPDMKVPDDPLPASVSDDDGDEPDKPSYPERPKVEKKENFSDTANYQVLDVEGPGCGWEWSNWEKPDETEDQLNKKKDNAINIVRTRVNNDASNYVDGQIDWAWGIMSERTRAADWNEYADEANSVHDSWKKLNADRDKYKKPWNEYVKKHDYWYNFEDIKSQADVDYREEKKKCQDLKKEQSDWDKKYDGKKSHGGGDTGVPKRPKTCKKDPKKPKILEQDRPKEPIPPELPDDVTIPDDWKKPEGE